MPSRPQHDWRRYLGYCALFLLAHAAARFLFGGVSSGWVILSAGAFGLALGVRVGQAEQVPPEIIMPSATPSLRCISRAPSCRYYTDGYEVMTLFCPAFLCIVGLLLGAAAAAFL